MRGHDAPGDESPGAGQIFGAPMPGRSLAAGVPAGALPTDAGREGFVPSQPAAAGIGARLK